MRITHIMRHVEPHRKRVLPIAAACLALPLLLGQLALAEGRQVNFSVVPVAEGKVTSRYGIRTDPFTGARSNHRGLDIKAPLGTPVRAPAAGRVVRAEELGAYGNLMEIAHEGGVVTRYAQLESFALAVGDKVRAGDLIARVGSSGQSTGPHLHIEVFVDGERVDPETMIKLPTKP